MMSKPIRWGICSTGQMAHQFADDFRFSKGGELAAVCSRSLQNAEQFAGEFRIRHAFGSLESMVAADVVDIVYIASPHSAHYEQALSCLSADCHVLCEKPMTLSAKTTKNLYQTARDNNCFIMEALWVRFNPVLNKVKDLIEQRVIGTVQQLNVQFGFHAAVPPDHRLLNPALGGGALLDVGIYPVFMAHYLFGKPEQIKSTVKKSDRGVDLAGNVLFSYDSGVQAHLYSSLVTHLPNNLVVAGTHGYIEVAGLWLNNRQLMVVNENGEQKINCQFPGAGWHLEVAHVNQCLQSGMKASPVYRPQDSIEIAEIMGELLDSWEVKYVE